MKDARRVGGVVIMALGMVVGGCSATAPPSAVGSTPSANPATASAVASPANSPSETSDSSTPAPAGVSDAPLATLVVAGQRHPGEVGGFTFGRFSESAPWLPATALEAIRVEAGTELRVELDERASVKDWSARTATAADVTADAVKGLASGTGPVGVFTAPEAGDWVVSVTITYGDGLGSAAYYWHLRVD